MFEDNFNYLSKMCLLRMRTAACTMLAMAKARGCTTIVCGSDASDHLELYLAEGADYAGFGEGETTVGELVDHLASAESASQPDGEGRSNRSIRLIDQVRGLAFRDQHGTVVTTARRANRKDLDALARPAWDLIDIEPYRAAWKAHGRFSMNVVSTRGCPFQCNWCAKPIWGQRYNSHSPEHVVAELEHLRSTYRPDHISFVDDIFGLKPGWLRAYADLVVGRDLVVPFKCLSRADLLLRPGEVDALRDAGCEMVWMGAESGSQAVLDAMDKGITVEQIHEATCRLRAAGIRVGFFLQFGYPGEGTTDIDATRRLVRQCRPDDIGISVSYPLPGTEFHARVRSDLGPQHNWIDSEDLAMLYRGPFSTEYYRQLHTVVHKEFRLRGSAGPAPRRRRPLARLARARDALTLPHDERTLRRMARREQAS